MLWPLLKTSMGKKICLKLHVMEMERETRRFNLKKKTEQEGSSDPRGDPDLHNGFLPLRLPFYCPILSEGLPWARGITISFSDYTFSENLKALCHSFLGWILLWRNLRLTWIFLPIDDLTFCQDYQEKLSLYLKLSLFTRL